MNDLLEIVIECINPFSLKKYNYIALSDGNKHKGRILKFFKDCRVIYFLFKEKELQYIGTSVNISRRLYEHKRRNEIPFNKYSFIQVYEDYKIQETLYINIFNPPYNKQ